MTWILALLLVLTSISGWKGLLVRAFPVRLSVESQRTNSWSFKDGPGLTAAGINTLESPKMVPRISRDKFNPFRDYYQYCNGDGSSCGRPILIEGALSATECQECCDHLMTQAEQFQVDLQQQTEKKRTKLYECSLDQAIEIIMRKSSSQMGFLAFCEGLLDENGGALQDIQGVVTNAKESLFGEDTDCFDFFPPFARPTDAVIVAGAGATSTLHRDPMEWTGTSLCLEGTKVWRFMEPPKQHTQYSTNTEEAVPVAALDEALQAYRLQSIAWECDSESTVPLSAGWQSDFSLYHTRNHEAIPSAQELAEMDDAERLELMLSLVTNLESLKPNVPSSTFFAQRTTIHTAIQQPGDLLLIPPHWWHQTYGLEPSVAVASQRCGKCDVGLVFRHILDQQYQLGHENKERLLEAMDMNGEPKCTSLKSYFQKARPQEMVATLLSAIYSSSF